MRPTDIKLTLVAVIAALLLVGCGAGPIPSAAVDSGAPSAPTEVSTDSALGSTQPPGDQTPSGPCLSLGNEVVGDGVEITVTNGIDSVIPAFGWDEIGYCPGHPQYGTVAMTGDGFYLAIEEATLDVTPGQEFGVIVSGPVSPQLEASLEIAVVTEIEPGKLQWALTAPTTPGTRDVDIGVYWDEGESHHRIRLVVTEP